MRRNRYLFFLAGIIFLNIQFAVAQDFRDIEHTSKFADYLFKTKQFVLAAEEYERLVFYDSINYYPKLILIQSYRYSNNYKNALTKFDYFFKDSLYKLRSDFAEEYVKNLILNKTNNEAYNYLESNISLNASEVQTYQLGTLLLDQKWDSAFNYALKHSVTSAKKNADLHLIAFKSKQMKYKSPFLAASLSTIIPGTGKMYTKHWKDGLISMMFVGVNAWQSYRGFRKSGNNSVYGWVFAGLATGFYIGNIFGSQKSAKNYNKKLQDELYSETWHILVDDF